MEITTKTDADVLKIRLSGRLDSSTANLLEDCIAENIKGMNRLIFDFKDLDYMSSAGLRVILASHMKMKNLRGMIVRNINDTIKEVFDITGFTDIIDVEN